MSFQAILSSIKEASPKAKATALLIVGAVAGIAEFIDHSEKIKNFVFGIITPPEIEVLDARGVMRNYKTVKYDYVMELIVSAQKKELGDLKECKAEIRYAGMDDVGEAQNSRDIGYAAFHDELKYEFRLHILEAPDPAKPSLVRLNCAEIKSEWKTVAISLSHIPYVPTLVK